MGNRAIYSVIENGETSYFHTKWGANQYLPFITIKTAESIFGASNNRPTLADIMPTLTYNQLYNHDAGFDGHQIFEKISDDKSEKVISKFGSNTAVAMHITINLDHDLTDFEYNPLSYIVPPPSDFSVNISDGLCCLEEAIDEAAQEIEPLYAVIENKMMNKLQSSMEQSNQQNMSF